MVGTTAPSAQRLTVRVPAVGVALTILAATAVVARILAAPSQAPTFLATGVRALADCAAVVAFGLAVVRWFDEPRRREELAARAAGPLAVSGGVWLLAELARQLISAASAAAVPVTRLPLTTAIEYTVTTPAGRAGSIVVVAAFAVTVAALRSGRTARLSAMVAGTAAVGIAARTISGHVAENPLASTALAVHVLAAAVWCGGLAALAMTVTHRGQWARVLPRFAQISLVCVAVLLLSGVAGALVVVGVPDRLYADGYGRVLLAKIVLAAVLVIMAWRNRSGWLPAARGHRVSAERSRARSAAEVAVMVAALTMASALALTG